MIKRFFLRVIALPLILCQLLYAQDSGLRIEVRAPSSVLFSSQALADPLVVSVRPAAAPTTPTAAYVRKWAPQTAKKGSAIDTRLRIVAQKPINADATEPAKLKAGVAGFETTW